MQPSDTTRDELSRSLHAVADRVRFVSVSSAAGVWITCTLLSLLGFVVWDHWSSTGVPDAAGLVLRIVYLLISGSWLTLAVVVPLFRRISDVYAARLIERVHPEFRNSIVAALQLSQHKELPGSMRWALVARAAGDMAGIDARDSVSSARIRRTARAAVTIAALFGVYTIFSPKPVLPSVQRALGVSLPPPTRTLLSHVLPPDGSQVTAGDPVTFSARVQGSVPDRAVVRFTRDEGRTWIGGEQLELLKVSEEGGEEVWRAVKNGRDVQGNFDWQVVAGDARSELRRLGVQPVPALTDMRVRYEYPRYTRLPPSSQPGGDIDAVIGTKVRITGKANVPAHAPTLITGLPPEEKRRVLKPPTASRPSEITAELTVTSDDVYRIRFADARGTPSREPVQYTIHARPDKPPEIQVDDPPDQARMSAGEVFRAVGRASDDFGLGRLTLCHELSGRPGVQEHPLPVEGGGPRNTSLSAEISLSSWGVKPGDVVQWWVSAWDNRETPDGRPAGQRTDSPRRTLTIDTSAQLARAPDAAPESPGMKPQGRSTSAPAADDSETVANAQSPTSAQEQQGSGSAQSQPAVGQASEPRGIEEFEKDHARELEALARHLEQPATAPSSDASGTSETQDRPAGESPTTQTGEARVESEQRGEGDPAGANDTQQASAEKPREASNSSATAPSTMDLPPTGTPVAGGESAPQAPATTQLSAPDAQSPADQRDRNADGPAPPRDNPTPSTGEPAGRDPQPSTGGEQRVDTPARDAGAAQDQPMPPPDTRPSGSPEQQDAAQKGESPARSSEPTTPTEQTPEAQSQGQPAKSGGTPPSEQQQSDAPSNEGGASSDQKQNEGSEEPDSQGPGAGKPAPDANGEAAQPGGTLQPQPSDGGPPGGPIGQAPGAGETPAPDAQAPGQGKTPSPGETPSPGGGNEPGAGQSAPKPGQQGGPTPGEGSSNAPTGAQQSGPLAKASGFRPGGGADRGGPASPPPTTKPAGPTDAPDAPPANASPLTTNARTQAVVNELERALRAGRVPDDLLRELGWDLDKARGFVDEFRRTSRQAQRQTEQTPPPEGESVGPISPNDARTRRAEQGAVEGVRPPVTANHRPSDSLRGLEEPGRQRVAPQYRAILEAYYRSVATRPASR